MASVFSMFALIAVKLKLWSPYGVNYDVKSADKMYEIHTCITLNFVDI